MSLLSQLRDLYGSSYAVRSWREDVSLHLKHGYLIKTPEYIVMGKAVVRWMSDEELRDPRIKCPEGVTPDAWYVYLYCGTACNFLSFEPYPLDYVGWHRRGKLRWYRTTHFQERCKTMTPFLIDSFAAA